MKTPRRQKFLAFFLAIALSLTLIPAQVLALEIDQRKGSLQIECAEAASAEPAQDAEIVSEIPSGRDAYQKEFLLSNGQRMLAVYPTAIHYQENGQWEEIDNTLRLTTQNGSAVYRNTAGIWNVTLPAQIDAQQAVSVEQDGYRLSFRFAGSLRRTPVRSSVQPLRIARRRSAACPIPCQRPCRWRGMRVFRPRRFWIPRPQWIPCRQNPPGMPCSGRSGRRVCTRWWNMHLSMRTRT